LKFNLKNLPPTIPSVCLFIYTYTRTTLSLLVYLAPHSTRTLSLLSTLHQAKPLLVCLAPPSTRTAPNTAPSTTKHQTKPPYPLLSTLPLTHPPALSRCVKPLKIKRLSDVGKALKIKELMRGLVLL
jgi:hypothetical protein